MELRVAGVHALRRKGNEEVLVDLEPGRRQLGQQHLTGEAREGGALQHHDLLAVHARQQHLGRVENERVVWIFGLVERGGHADDHCIRLAQHLGIVAGPQLALRDQRRQHGRGNVRDMRLAGLDGVHLFAHAIVGRGGEPGPGDLHRQRKTHVTGANHHHLGGTIPYAFE